MTAPPQRPAVAFKPGDRDPIALYRELAISARGATDTPAPPPAAADDGLRERIVEALKAKLRLYVEDRDEIADAILPLFATHLAEIEALKAENARLTSERDGAREKVIYYADLVQQGQFRASSAALDARDAAESRATRAEAALASAAEEKQAIITLLYSDEVFVGSEWVDFPNAEKGVWPTLCAHTANYGADSEIIPHDQIVPLAALVEKHGRGTVQGWVCFRRGLDKPVKGDLDDAGRAALADLAARPRHSPRSRERRMLANRKARRALNARGLTTFLFFRRGEKGDLFFYPVEIPPGHLDDNIRLNPGTVKVEDVQGNIVWADTPSQTTEGAANG